jgi:hypothetical protein
VQPVSDPEAVALQAKETCRSLLTVV